MKDDFVAMSQQVVDQWLGIGTPPHLVAGAMSTLVPVVEGLRHTRASTAFDQKPSDFVAALYETMYVDSSSDQ